MNPNKVRILFIANDERKLSSTINFLKKRGWQAAVIRTMKEALPVISKEKPSHILVSWHLSSSNVAKIERTIHSTFGIPCIIFSETELDASSVGAINAAGIKQYIKSPVSGPSVHVKIRKLLQENLEAEQSSKSAGAGGVFSQGNDAPATALNDIPADANWEKVGAAENGEPIWLLKTNKKNLTDEKKKSTMVFKGPKPPQYEDGSWKVPESGGSLREVEVNTGDSQGENPLGSSAKVRPPSQGNTESKVRKFEETSESEDTENPLKRRPGSKSEREDEERSSSGQKEKFAGRSEDQPEDRERIQSKYSSFQDETSTQLNDEESEGGPRGRVGSKSQEGSSPEESNRYSLKEEPENPVLHGRKFAELTDQEDDFDSKRQKKEEEKNSKAARSAQRKAEGQLNKDAWAKKELEAQENARDRKNVARSLREEAQKKQESDYLKRQEEERDRPKFQSSDDSDELSRNSRHATNSYKNEQQKRSTGIEEDSETKERSQSHSRMGQIKNNERKQNGAIESRDDESDSETPDSELRRNQKISKSEKKADASALPAEGFDEAELQEQTGREKKKPLLQKREDLNDQDRNPSGNGQPEKAGKKSVESHMSRKESGDNKDTSNFVNMPEGKLGADSGKSNSLTEEDVSKNMTFRNKTKIFGKNADTLLARSVIKALEKVVVETPENVSVESIGEVTHLDCIPINTTRFKGLLMFCTGQSKHAGFEFARKVKVQLMELLREQGEEMKDEGELELEVGAFSFVAVVSEFGEFVTLSRHAGQELGMAFVQNDSAIPEVKPSPENHNMEKMVQVILESVETDKPISFDAYIHLPKNNKYIRYVRKGGKIEERQKEKMTEFEVRHFYIRDNDILLYKGHCASAVVERMVRKFLAAIKKSA